MTREVYRLSAVTEVPLPSAWPRRPVDRILSVVEQCVMRNYLWMERAEEDAATREKLKAVQGAVEDSDASALAEALAMDVEDARTRRLPTRRGR